MMGGGGLQKISSGATSAERSPAKVRSQLWRQLAAVGEIEVNTPSFASCCPAPLVGASKVDGGIGTTGVHPAGLLLRGIEESLDLLDAWRN
jgi:hypothetical protein